MCHLKDKFCLYKGNVDKLLNISEQHVLHTYKMNSRVATN